MAFDGILVRALRDEISSVLQDARLNKIIQPEKEELELFFKTKNGQERLLMSGSASLPFLYLTDESKQAPVSAPA